MARYVAIIGFNSAVNAARFSFNNPTLSPQSVEVTQGFTPSSGTVGQTAPGVSTPTVWVMVTSDSLNQLTTATQARPTSVTFDTQTKTFLDNTKNIDPNSITVTQNQQEIFKNGVLQTPTTTQPPVPDIPQSLQDQIIQQQLLQQQLNDQLKQYLEPEQPPIVPIPAIPQSLQDQITQYNLQQQQLLDQLNQYFTPSPPVDSPFPYQPIFDNPDLRKMVQPQPYQNPNDPMIIDPTQPYDPLSLPGFDPGIDPQIFQFPPGMQILPPQTLQRISDQIQLPEITIKPEGQPYEQVSPPDLMPPPGFEIVPGDQFETISPRSPVFQKPLPPPSDNGEGIGGGGGAFTGVIFVGIQGAQEDAVNGVTANPVFYYSTDGLAWYVASVGPFSSGLWFAPAILYGNGTFFGTIQSWPTPSTSVLGIFSSNGKTWRTVYSQPHLFTFSFNSATNQWNDTTHGVPIITVPAGVIASGDDISSSPRADPSQTAASAFFSNNPLPSGFTAVNANFAVGGGNPGFQYTRTPITSAILAGGTSLPQPWPGAAWVNTLIMRNAGSIDASNNDTLYGPVSSLVTP